MSICLHCKFWVKSEKFNHGACHLNPPIGDSPSMTGERRGVWPRSHPQDWCGKFKPHPGDINNDDAVSPTLHTDAPKKIKTAKNKIKK